jgi:hypothetical protein
MRRQDLSGCGDKNEGRGTGCWEVGVGVCGGAELIGVQTEWEQSYGSLGGC